MQATRRNIAITLILILGSIIGAAQQRVDLHKLDLATRQKEAEAGDAVSQFLLGYRYFTGGEGVSQDYGQAAVWFRKAADQGRADAQYYLGIINELGDGMAPDIATALIWLQKSANQGYQPAKDKLVELGAGSSATSQASIPEPTAQVASQSVNGGCPIRFNCPATKAQSRAQ